jgi:putative PIN family toxin of toxin-antitoxin system
MRIVVDTNIIFSLLLSGKGNLHNIIFDDELELTAPNFIIIELFKHKEKIRKYSKLTEDEILELMTAITDRISFFLFLTLPRAVLKGQLKYVKI